MKGLAFAFTGDTVTETIARIAHATPEAIARLNYDVPPELEVSVKKTPRKDRDRTWRARIQTRIHVLTM